MGKKKPKAKVSKSEQQHVAQEYIKNTTEKLASETKMLTSKTDKLLASSMEAIAAAICSANQAVFMKVCRLCEAKDGPFLNIFDADKVTAKKIDELMPFGIAENDDLPHKICFRCSAKVEELYEFVQKCIKTQHNLNATMGKKSQIQTKTRTQTLWEEKLNKSNMSNDEICDALIKKAMEGIKDIPLNASPAEKSEPSPLKNEKPVTVKRISKPTIESSKPPAPPAEVENKSDDDISNFDKKFIPTRSSRSQKPDSLLDGLPDYKKKKNNNKQSVESPEKLKEESSPSSRRTVQIISDSENSSETEDSSTKNSLPSKPEPVQEAPKPVEQPKPFNIMDHISMIKVNGVGVLFQCRLCNRNFLKKDVVVTHGCAKTGVPKVDLIKPVAPPEPPKIPTVKYINTKIDGELGKPPVKLDKKQPETEPEKPVIPESKPKPRIGPASKVKKLNNHNALIGMTVAPIEDEKSDTPAKDPQTKEQPAPVKSVSKSPPETPTAAPSVQFPVVPSLNSRYKLVPGPNNTFQLVEESPTPTLSTETDITIKKRKSNVDHVENNRSKVTENSYRFKPNNPEVVRVSDPPPLVHRKSDEQPYPVGLFQTLPHHSAVYSSGMPSQPPAFTTPAMKKQSYTIVQTGNPSKLLISTKPQVPIEEPPKKRVKKNKHETRTLDQQPFNVTLEDAAHPKDHGFFNFINVDPLLQPSYVLPTDSIIQESQISTSSSVLKSTVNNKEKEKEKYSCNMCGETFSREKKLLAHIQSHYSKMDEEDMRREKNSKKRSKRTT